jgi:hypothetical protein
VVKVGGDYMRARMWIPVTFALLLPVMMPPLGRGEPMSVRRFWDHLTGSLARTSLRIPADSFEAERQFCRQQVRAEEIDNDNESRNCRVELAREFSQIELWMVWSLTRFCGLFVCGS